MVFLRASIVERRQKLADLEALKTSIQAAPKCKESGKSAAKRK
jgi:hypothetical protein